MKRHASPAPHGLLPLLPSSKRRQSHRVTRGLANSSEPFKVRKWRPQKIEIGGISLTRWRPVENSEAFPDTEASLAAQAASQELRAQRGFPSNFPQENTMIFPLTRSQRTAISEELSINPDSVLEMMASGSSPSKLAGTKVKIEPKTIKEEEITTKQENIQTDQIMKEAPPQPIKPEESLKFSLPLGAFKNPDNGMKTE